MQSEEPLSHEPYATLITVSKVHQLGSDDYLILYGFFGRVLIKTRRFPRKKMHLKMWSENGGKFVSAAILSRNPHG